MANLLTRSRLTIEHRNTELALRTPTHTLQHTQKKVSLSRFTNIVTKSRSSNQHLNSGTGFGEIDGYDDSESNGCSSYNCWSCSTRIHCDDGYHLEGSVCVLNECKCDNGITANGTECPTHDSVKCTWCSSVRRDRVRRVAIDRVRRLRHRPSETLARGDTH